MIYNPKDYWEDRLSSKFNLSGVGHLGFSEHYNKFLYKAKIRALKKVILSQHIDIHSKTVCDIGCGTGFFVSFYQVHGVKDIVGVDITSIGIANLKRKYPQYLFIKQDISSSLLVSIINRKFDILNAFDVLYHITDDKAFEAAIANFGNMIQDNGFIFISDSFGSEIIHTANHVKFRTKEIYKTILDKTGFIIIGIWPLYCLLNRPILGIGNIPTLRNIGIRLDNIFAPIYFVLDSVLLSPRRNNLGLMIAKKVKK